MGGMGRAGGMLRPALAAAVLAASRVPPPSAHAQALNRPPAVEAERRARTVLDLMRLGRRLLSQGDPRGAAMEFEKVIQLDPSNSAAAECLARCMSAVSCGVPRGGPGR
jgi:Tfp pilus assembly protein PilF